MWAFSIFFIWAPSAMNFLLSTAFIVSHRFGYVVSSFSLNSRKTLISFLIFSLTQGWLSSWLFTFHKFVGFLGVVLLLNSNFIPWWSDKTQVVYSNFFVSVDVCFVTKSVISFWEGSTRCWEEGLFPVWVDCSIDVC